MRSLAALHRTHLAREADFTEHREVTTERPIVQA